MDAHSEQSKISPPLVTNECAYIYLFRWSHITVFILYNYRFRASDPVSFRRCRRGKSNK